LISHGCQIAAHVLQVVLGLQLVHSCDLGARLHGYSGGTWSCCCVRVGKHSETARRCKSRSLHGGAHTGPCAYALELSLEFIDLLGAPAGRLADLARPRWHESHGSRARSRVSSSLRRGTRPASASSSLAQARLQLRALQPVSSSLLFSPRPGDAAAPRPRRTAADVRGWPGTAGDGRAGRRKRENLVLDLKDPIVEELRL
jgi:hypothetical protein